MKEKRNWLFILLLVWTLYLITGQLSYSGIKLNFVNPNIVDLLMFIISLIVSYWLFEDYKNEFGFDHISKQMYIEFKRYAEKKCNPQKEQIDLSTDFFNQIIETKDIYYINHYLIVKSANSYVDRRYRPIGYKMSISKIKYKFLHIYYLFKSLLKPENFICIILLMWFFCIICWRIYHYMIILKR